MNYYIWIVAFALEIVAVLLLLWRKKQLTAKQLLNSGLIAAALNIICAGILGLGVENNTFSVGILILYFIGNYLLAIILKKQVLKWLLPGKQIIAKYLTFCTPIICFCLIELIFSGTEAFSIMELQYKLINIAILYAVFIIVYYILFPYKVTLILYTLLGVIYSTVNFYVAGFRNGNAILPSEILAIKTALNVSGNYSVELSNQIPALLLGTLIFLGIIIYLPNPKYRKRNTLKNIAGALGLIAIVGMGYGSIDFCEEFGLNLNYWDISQSYSEYGTPLTFLTLCQNMSVDKPEGYSVEKAEEILEPYDARVMNQEMEINERPTVIAIMNESFSDLNIIREFETSPDYLSFWKSFEEPAMKGNLLVPVYGGGTCNTEFEFLTGLSMGNLPRGIYPYQMYDLNSVESLPRLFRELGYDTLAIHPGKAASWNRAQAFAALGFDDFMSEEDFDAEESDYLRGFISDAACYKKLIEAYENRKNEMFIFCVTIQNHGGYENITFDGLTIKSNDHYLIRSNSGSLTNVSFKNLSLSGTRAYLIDNNSGNINNLNLANVTLNGEAESIIHTNSANLSRVTVDTLKATGYMVDFIETNSGSITDSQFTNMTFTGRQTTFIKVNSSNLQRVGFTNLKLDGTNSEASFIQDNSGALDTVSFDIEIKGRQPRFIGNNNSSLTNIKFNQIDIEGYQASFIQNNGGMVLGSFVGKVEGEDACFINLNNGRYDFDWTDKFVVKDHITNIWELNNFSTYVYNGQVKIDAVLDNNINAAYENFTPIAYLDNNIDAAYDNFTPIAYNNNPYQGTFDGNGKAIYNFYSNGYGASFIFNNAGTVKHLEISGQVFGEASDFVSHNGKTGLIQDCALILDITGETYDDLFGVTHYGRTANSFENNEGTIKNIFFAGRLTNIRSENDPRNREGTVDHFYYLDQFGVIGGKAIRVSRRLAESGEIAHRLAANSTIGWMQVREYWHYDILSSRPGFSGDKGDQTKPMAEKPSLSINDIDRTEKSLRVTKKFDSKVLDEYGGVRYELLDKDGHVLGNGWQESPEFTNLAPKTEYQVAVRFNGNGRYLPSDATIVKVKTKGIAPAVELKKDDIKRTNTSLEVTKKYGSEYGGVHYQLKDTQGNVVKDWQKDNKFTGLTPGTEYQLVAQYVGNDDYVASKEVIVNVKTTKEAETPELSSADVKRGDTSLKVTKQFDTDK